MVNSFGNRANGGKIRVSVNKLARGIKLGHTEDRTRIGVNGQKTEESLVK